MDIKEIALKVRATTPVSPDPDKYVEDLFTNFVAEIQRQNPQVGLATLGKAMLSMSFIEATMNNAEPIKLYTIPPTAKQIANETAWQPIETAPKGERFLTTTKLSNGSFGQVGISHSFFCYEVNTRDWEIAGDDPCATHWMPLPKAPNGASS